jgi:hypothetical protein
MKSQVLGTQQKQREGLLSRVFLSTGGWGGSESDNKQVNK